MNFTTYQYVEINYKEMPFVILHSGVLIRFFIKATIFATE